MLQETVTRLRFPVSALVFCRCGWEWCFDSGRVILTEGVWEWGALTVIW
jgi:hypothetical protein